MLSWFTTSAAKAPSEPAPAEVTYPTESPTSTGTVTLIALAFAEMNSLSHHPLFWIIIASTDVAGRHSENSNDSVADRHDETGRRDGENSSVATGTGMW